MAPKGSKLNNPFRMLPRGVMAIIKPMTKSWTPTPSALAIKQADVSTDYHGWGDHLEVYMPQQPFIRYYLLPHRVDERVMVHYPLGRVVPRRELKFRKYIQGLRKGSALNSPFRMLPSEVLANIKAMKSDKHPPTQTALLIKDLNFDWDDHLYLGALTVFTHPRQGINFRERNNQSLESNGRAPVLETTMLMFHLDFIGFKRLEVGPEHEPPLGRVLSDNEVTLRRMQRNPAMSGTQELRRQYLLVQQESWQRQ